MTDLLHAIMDENEELALCLVKEVDDDWDRYIPAAISSDMPQLVDYFMDRGADISWIVAQ